MRHEALDPALIEALARARHVVALTGSGVSAESGIPTFRDAQTGLWSRFRPEELATPGAFERDPELVWNWYAWRRRRVAAAEPNAGHHALAQLERLVPRCTLITQNVDGLHQRAGSSEVVEYHGNILRSRCTREGRAVEPAADDGRAPPRCPGCGAMLRPDVVWFGEAIPPAALAAAGQALTDCDVFFAIGTSAVVHPAAGLIERARARGAVVIEVNPDATAASGLAHYLLRGASGAMLPALVGSLGERLGAPHDP